MNLSSFKKVDVVQAEDGQSMYLDFDLVTHLARLTLYRWDIDAGACDLEILNVKTEEQELWEHREFHDAVQFYSLLAEFRNRLDALVDTPSATMSQSHSHPFEFFLEGKRIGLGGILEPLLMSG